MRDPDKQELKRKLRELDGILPESVDRRKFLTGTVGGFLAGAAGCLGGGGGNDSTPTPRVETVVKEEERTVVKEVTAADRIINKNTMYRAAWKAENDYAVGHAAARQGFWNEAGITPPQARAGVGSTDTVKRIASDSHVTQFGNAGVGAFTSGLNQGLDLVLIGSFRAMAFWAFQYEVDKFDGPTDLAGKKVLTTGDLGTKIFPMYAEAAGVPMEDINNEFGKEAFTTQALGSDDQADAVWGSIAGIDKRRELSDVEIAVNPLWCLKKLMGYGLYANKSWMNESDENMEYTKRMLEGYSRAGKWVLLNPEKSVEMMDTVNPQLQTLETSQKLATLKTGLVAPNLTEDVRDRGFGALNEEAAKNTVTDYAELLDQDLPPAEETLMLDFNADAELEPFTDDEWQQVREFGEPWSSAFLDCEQQPWK